jgi:membrane protease YdiL (CAAX protease family)
VVTVVVMFVVSGVVLVAGAIAFGFSAEELEDPEGGVFLLMMVATWIGELTWPTIVLFWRGTGRPVVDWGLRFRWWDLAWAVGGFVFVNAFSVWAGIVYLLVSDDAEVPTNTDMVDTDQASTAMLVLLFIGIAIITPLFEEIVFRGFLLRGLDRSYGVAPALLSTSVVFGLLHLGGISFDDLFVVVLLTCYGVVFGALTIANKGRIGASVICHMLNNGMVFAVVML